MPSSWFLFFSYHNDARSNTHQKGGRILSYSTKYLDFILFTIKIKILSCTLQHKFMQWLKPPTLTETIMLNRLRWFGHVQRMEDNRIPKKVLYMNLETSRLKGRTRNRWQNEVREDGRIVGGKGWKGRLFNREEWKKLLRTVRNLLILHVPMEWMNITA